MRELLGGKGANVAEMTRVLGRRARAGRVHDHDRGLRGLHGGRRASSRRGSRSRSPRRSARLEEQAGKRLGDADDPLLVSVRSRRARVDARHARHGPQPRPERRVGGGLARRPGTSASPGTPTGASCRCSATSAAGSPGERYEELIKERKREAGVEQDIELSSTTCKALTDALQGAVSRRDRRGVPAGAARAADARRSARCSTPGWASARSSYRRINRIPDEWGTAVNVQQMVFGNKGDARARASRSRATRSPASREPSGDFLPNAQGEDVVSGVRTPRDMHELERPDARGLRRADGDPAHARAPLRRHAGHRVHRGGGAPVHAPDAQRQAPGAGGGAVRGRRGGGGAARHARRRSRRSTPAGLDALLHPAFARDADFEVLAEGVAASPGAAKGAIVFTAEDAVAAAEEGRDVILVRPFTEADDVAGFHAAKGILTAEGGKASHAALVARGMGKPCVSGAADARDRPPRQDASSVDGTELQRGRPDRDRRHAPAWSRPTTCRSRSPR